MYDERRRRQAGGVCAGTTTVCTALDQCHVAGTCDPTTGVCGNPTAADGTFCGDAEAACVKQDTCVSGACQDNGFKDATTACGDPSNSACDHPDHCTGIGQRVRPELRGRRDALRRCRGRAPTRTTATA